MLKTVFVNLPVTDVPTSTQFYAAIGCTLNPQFSDEKASSMAWSEAVTFQLLARSYFATFTSRPVADAQRSCQVLFALTCESRKAVDVMVDAAASAGGRRDVRDVMDLGWLYNRAFADPDGHVFEAVWLDAQAMPAA